MPPSIENDNGFNNSMSPNLVQSNTSQNSEIFDFNAETFVLRNGLKNLGNTCFLNSAVQMLFSLENGFIEDLLNPCGGKLDTSMTTNTVPRKKKILIEDSQNDNSSQINVDERQSGCTYNTRSERPENALNDGLEQGETMYPFQCCGGFLFPSELSELVDLCWPNNSLEENEELTQEEVQENAKKLQDALVQIGKKLTDVDTNANEVDPTAIKVAIDAKTRQFVGYKQHDSHEFLTTMLDMLSDEEKEYAKNWADRDSDSLENEKNKKISVVDQHFSSHIRVTLKCYSCGLSRSRIEVYRHISLDINPGSTSSLEECVSKFFEPGEREVQCEQCCCNNALETREFIKLPNALLLHLKRFIVDIGPDFKLQYRKINERVKFKNILNVGQYFSTDTPLADFACAGLICDNPFTDIYANEIKSDNLDTTYKLKSVVHHLGTNANRGHYTADVLTRNKDKELWMRCSDSVVTPCTDIQNAILGARSQKGAYMIMYEKLKPS